jgi:hypothetical protein
VAASHENISGSWGSFIIPAQMYPDVAICFEHPGRGFGVPTKKTLWLFHMAMENGPHSK